MVRGKTKFLKKIKVKEGSKSKESAIKSNGTLY